MHLRRALLLFAIVLGVAALAASISRPNDDEQPEPPPPLAGPARAAPGPAASRPRRLRFVAGGKREQHRLGPGRPATVTVEVRGAGLVELRGLGLSAPADRLTPARFDVLTRRHGRFSVTFTPAAGDETRALGRLVVGQAATSSRSRSGRSAAERSAGSSRSR